jgi:hypothetical protein
MLTYSWMLWTVTLNIFMFLSKGQCDQNMYTWLCVNVCGSAAEDRCRNEEKLAMSPTGSEPTMPGSQRPQTHALSARPLGSPLCWWHFDIIRPSQYGYKFCPIRIQSITIGHYRTRKQRNTTVISERSITLWKFCNLVAEGQTTKKKIFIYRQKEKDIKWLINAE